MSNRVNVDSSDVGPAVVPLFDAPDQAVSLSNRLLTASRTVFTPLALVCLIYFAWEARATLSELISRSEPSRLAAAGILWAVLHLLSPMLPVVVFRAFGANIGYRDALLIHTGRLPARYIPGGIWHTVTRALDFSSRGIDKRQLALFVYVEHLLALGAAFVLGGCGIAVTGDAGGWDGIALAALAVGGCLLIGGRYFANRLILRDGPALPMRAYVAASGIIIAFWLLAAASFVCYLSAFPSLGGGVSYIEAGSAYLLSWGIGFIAVFSPQGIGVFEIVAGSLLSLPLALGGAAALLAGFRMVILAADLLAWAGASLYRRAAQGIAD